MADNPQIAPDRRPETTEAAIQEASDIARANLRIVPEQKPESTRAAIQEASEISRGDLRRYESVRTHIHYAGLVILWTVVIGALVLALIWGWHLATPERLHFLGVEQRNDIQMILLSVVGSSFATQVAREWIHPGLPREGDNGVQERRPGL